jgi:hypothetical protein
MSETAAPADVTVLDAPIAVAAPTCDVCGHPMSAHDRISSRFCDATQAGALSRGCICRV